MANTLGYYNPAFYANEALILLEDMLGMSARVHRGYDAERRAFGKGQTINIRRPSAMTVDDAPETAVDLSTDSVQISLDYWRESKFKLTDRELAFTSEQIIQEHIRPQVHALASDIEAKLWALYKDVPRYVLTGAAASVANIVNTRKVMADAKVPIGDQALGYLNYMVSPTIEAELLQLPVFHQANTGAAGADLQTTGALGKKFGFNFGMSQNAPTHTTGTNDDTAITLDGAVAKGATSMTFDAAGTGTFTAGDIIYFGTLNASDYDPYTVTATATIAGNAVTVSVSPPARAIVADDTTATCVHHSKEQSIAFHRNAFALATAPLSELGSELGAKIATATSADGSLSLRSRLYYVGDSSEVHVAMDVLYGVKTLDPDLAVRLIDNA